MVSELRSTIVLAASIQSMSDVLNTPLTFKKGALQITTTVTTNRQSGESDAAFAERHFDLVTTVVANRDADGWTLVSE